MLEERTMEWIFGRDGTRIPSIQMRMMIGARQSIIKKEMIGPRVRF